MREDIAKLLERALLTRLHQKCSDYDLTNASILSLAVRSQELPSESRIGWTVEIETTLPPPNDKFSWSVDVVSKLLNATDAELNSLMERLNDTLMAAVKEL